MLGYIGINRAIGITNLPEISDYSAREPLLRFPWFSFVMSLKQFQAISRFNYFADNSTALSHDDPMYDKLWKIQTVIDSGYEQSLTYFTPWTV